MFEAGHNNVTTTRLRTGSDLLKQMKDTPAIVISQENDHYSRLK
jgi:hypothetical protein